MLMFFIGMMVGGSLGILTYALVSANGNDD